MENGTRVICEKGNALGTMQVSVKVHCPKSNGPSQPLMVLLVVPRRRRGCGVGVAPVTSPFLSVLEDVKTSIEDLVVQTHRIHGACGGWAVLEEKVRDENEEEIR